MPSPARFCRRCGCETRSGTKFCERCGAALMDTGDAVASAVPAPPQPGDIVAVLRYRAPIDPAVTAAAHLRSLVRAAGLVAIAMGAVGLWMSSKGHFTLVGGWVISGAFVAWRAFVTIPMRMRALEWSEARRKLITPAVVNLVVLGVVPGLILLIAYFRSATLESAPPLLFERRE
jgi:hypothetical protein